MQLRVVGEQGRGQVAKREGGKEASGQEGKGRLCRLRQHILVMWAARVPADGVMGEGSKWVVTVSVLSPQPSAAAVCKKTLLVALSPSACSLLLTVTPLPSALA